MAWRIRSRSKRAGPATASWPATRQSSAPCCRSVTRYARSCAHRPPTSLGQRRRSGCASLQQLRARLRTDQPHRRRGPSERETGEERETHRRPNLAPFADDPHRSGLARTGPIFRERVIAPPSAPLIATTADALAVTLNATGRVDVDHLAELLDRDPATALAQLGEAVFRNPSTEAGRRTTPICRGPFAPSWRSPKRRPNRTCSMRATSRRCGWCSPRTSGRRTSPRVSVRRGYPPLMWKPSRPR